jgi:hypothetical protein
MQDARICRDAAFHQKLEDARVTHDQYVREHDPATALRCASREADLAAIREDLKAGYEPLVAGRREEEKS